MHTTRFRPIAVEMAMSRRRALRAPGFCRFPDRRFPDRGPSEAERWQDARHSALAILLHRCICSMQELSRFHWLAGVGWAEGPFLVRTKNKNQMRKRSGNRSQDPPTRRFLLMRRRIRSQRRRRHRTGIRGHGTFICSTGRIAFPGTRRLIGSGRSG
jgi:hypothetical protein